MFSRLASRAGSLAPVLNAQLQNRAVQCIATRSSSIGKHVENWEKANKTYYGPERDTTNFPHPRQAETSPPVRLGFIPETFFQAFYEKTGVTGPYMFGIGLTTYLLSSEVWIIEHGFTEFVAFWIAMYIVAKKVGPGMSKSLDQGVEEFVQKNWNEPLQKTKDNAQQTITDLETAIQREAGQKYLYESKKENVDLQLEALYRQRLAEVHQAVKKRLDYQADLESAKRRYEQEHMVSWIVNNVLKSISPAQEKESIKKCVADLKKLAV